MDDLYDISIRNDRTYWQTNAFIMNFFCDWKMQMIPLFVCFLLVWRNFVMY